MKFLKMYAGLTFIFEHIFCYLGPHAGVIWSIPLQTIKARIFYNGESMSVD